MNSLRFCSVLFLASVSSVMISPKIDWNAACSSGLTAPNRNAVTTPDAQSVQRHEDDERNHQGQNERDRTLESLVIGQNVPLLPGAIPTFGQWHSRSRSPRLSESGLGVKNAGGGDCGAKGTRPTAGCELSIGDSDAVFYFRDAGSHPSGPLCLPP